MGPAQRQVSFSVWQWWMCLHLRLCTCMHASPAAVVVVLPHAAALLSTCFVHGMHVQQLVVDRLYLVV